MASAQGVGGGTSQAEGREELILAGENYEQEISLGWGKFCGVSSWVICGIINDMNKRAG